MRIFEIIKENVNLREAAELYGIDVNRYGKALCPFHNDRYPSLYVADGKLDRLRRRLDEIHKEELEDGYDTAGVA